MWILLRTHHKDGSVWTNAFKYAEKSEAEQASADMKEFYNGTNSLILISITEKTGKDLKNYDKVVEREYDGYRYFRVIAKRADVMDELTELASKLNGSV